MVLLDEYVFKSVTDSVSYRLSEWLNYRKRIVQISEQAYPRKSDLFPFTCFGCNLLFVGNAAGISTFLTW